MLNRTLNANKQRGSIFISLQLDVTLENVFCHFSKPWTWVLISFSIKSLGSSREWWGRCRTIDALRLTWDSVAHDRLSNRSDPRWISHHRHECSDRFWCYQHWRQLLDNDWCYRWWQSCFPTSVLERAIRSEWRDNRPMLMSSCDIARQPRREIDRDQHYESERGRCCLIKQSVREEIPVRIQWGSSPLSFLGRHDLNGNDYLSSVTWIEAIANVLTWRTSG